MTCAEVYRISVLFSRERQLLPGNIVLYFESAQQDASPPPVFTPQAAAIHHDLITQLNRACCSLNQRKLSAIHTIKWTALIQHLCCLPTLCTTCHSHSQSYSDGSGFHARCLSHTHTPTPGAMWGSVVCPRPLRHVDRRSQGSKH